MPVRTSSMGPGKGIAGDAVSLCLFSFRAYFILRQATFFNNQRYPSQGLEALAILYSLPYAGLMWGMASFFAAFSLMIFQKSSFTVRLVVGVTWTVVAVLIIWSLLTALELKQAEPGLFGMSWGAISDEVRGMKRNAWSGIKRLVHRDSDDSRPSGRFRSLRVRRRSSAAPTVV
ncbi:hypothetical protein C8J56DRAFT_422939 [Mycena floridula]|nr:hypothetical protein C8J56DRAFT_422939 [Mycena floridula]